MGDGVLEETTGYCELLLTRFFGPKFFVFELFWLFKIET